MSKYNLTLPKMGESVEEATIVNWLKNVGDNIKMDDFIVEVATDKVDSEVPSDVEGVLIEKCFEINDVVKVGETLCVIDLTESSSKKNIETIPGIEMLEIEEKPSITEDSEEVRQESKHTFLSPLVRSIIEKEKITYQQLDKIKGTGKGGRLTKKDLLQFLGKNEEQESLIELEKGFDDNPTQSFSDSDTMRELSRFEKMTSKHMIQSKNESVHAQMFIEADITNLFEWRENQKERFLQREKFKLTITYPLAKKVSQALREFP